MTSGRRPLPHFRALTCALLVSFLACSAVSSRTPLELQNETNHASVIRSDTVEKRLARTEGTQGQGEDDGLSLRQPDHDSEEPLITIPQFMDRMLSNAFSSVDRMSSGLLSGLTGPNIEYGRSEDGKRLIVRLHLPPLPQRDGQAAGAPKLSIAVLGRSHLRIKLDMQSDNFKTITEHSYALPVYVGSEGVTVTPQEDGTVHVSLPILKEASKVSAPENGDQDAGGQTIGSFLERRLRNPFFPLLIRRDYGDIAGSGAEFMEQLPRPEEIEQCRARYPHDKMYRKKCTCDVTPSKSGRAECYGALVSKAVSVARRLGMHDFATSAKHHAIECADEHVDAVHCLEKVASELLQSLYKGNVSGNQTGRLEDRVRVAIESEDDGPSNFEPSHGTVFSVVMIVLLAGMFLCGAMMCSVRRFGGASHSNRMLSELSSVLAQTTGSSAASNDSSGRMGPRRGPFQGTPAPSNSRVMRKPAAKSGNGESKIA